MYVRSRLKEEGITLYEVDVKDNAGNNSGIEYSEIKFDKKDEICVSGGIHHTDGFFIIETNFSNYADYTELLTKRGDYVQMSLLLTGSVATFKEKYNRVRDLPTGILQLVFRGDTDVSMKMPGNGEPMRYIRMFIARPFYLSLMQNESWINASPFYNEVKKNSYVHFGKNLIPTNATILNIIFEILDNNYDGAVKKYFIEHKLKELFLQLFITNTAGSNIPSITDELIAKLESAKAYLVTHYATPPTIKQLSRIISLNELKLKTGFKENFGSTIHDYVTKIRMQKARKMLADQQPVNEVSSHLGYKSVSHFISLFKKYHGATPKQAMLPDFLIKGKLQLLYGCLHIFYEVAAEAIFII